MPQPQRRSYARVARADYSQALGLSQGLLHSRPLGPVRAPVTEKGDLLLATGDRQQLQPAAQAALLAHLQREFPGCFLQFCFVRGDTAVELCADSTPAGSAAADSLLQAGHLGLVVPGGTDPLVLRVGVVSNGLAPGVQLLQLRDVPARYRREGFAAALLCAAGYAPSAFEVLAEGVGQPSAKLQRVCPGMGDGRFFLAYVRTPGDDFGLESLPSSFVLDGVQLRVKRVMPDTSAPCGMPAAAARGSPASQARHTHSTHRQLDLGGDPSLQARAGRRDAVRAAPPGGSPQGAAESAGPRPSVSSPVPSPAPAPPAVGRPGAASSLQGLQGGQVGPQRGSPRGPGARRRRSNSPGEVPAPPSSPPPTTPRGSPRGCASLLAPGGLVQEGSCLSGGLPSPVLPGAPLKPPTAPSSPRTSPLGSPVPMGLATGMDGLQGEGSPSPVLVTPSAGPAAPFLPGQTDKKKAKDSARRLRKEPPAVPTPSRPSRPSQPRRGPQADGARQPSGPSLAEGRPRRANAGKGGWQAPFDQKLGGGGPSRRA